MKKVSTLFISALTLGLAFTSCSKDDDNNDNGNNTPAGPSIEAKWNFNKYTVTYSGQTTPEASWVGNAEGCNKDYLELATNGVYNEGNYDGTACTLEQYHGTWTKTDNRVTVVVDGGTLQLDVVSLTDTELKATTNGEFEDGTPYVLNLTFTKA